MIKKYSTIEKCRGMLCCEGEVGVMCSLRCRPCWIILCEWVGTVGLVFQRVPAAHAQRSKVLNTKMQSVSEKHAWAHSLGSPRTLNFQFDSSRFNFSQLKPTTLKGNQCNRFVGSLLFLSPLWFPLAQTSSALVINLLWNSVQDESWVQWHAYRDFNISNRYIYWVIDKLVSANSKRTGPPIKQNLLKLFRDYKSQCLSCLFRFSDSVLNYIFWKLDVMSHSGLLLIVLATGWKNRTNSAQGSL